MRCLFFFVQTSPWLYLQDNSPDPAHQLTKTFSLNPKSITMEDTVVEPVAISWQAGAGTVVLVPVEVIVVEIGVVIRAVSTGSGSCCSSSCRSGRHQQQLEQWRHVVSGPFPHGHFRSKVEAHVQQARKLLHISSSSRQSFATRFAHVHTIHGTFVRPHIHQK